MVLSFRWLVFISIGVVFSLFSCTPGLRFSRISLFYFVFVSTVQKPIVLISLIAVRLLITAFTINC